MVSSQIYTHGQEPEKYFKMREKFINLNYHKINSHNFKNRNETNQFVFFSQFKIKNHAFGKLSKVTDLSPWVRLVCKV